MMTVEEEKTDNFFSTIQTAARKSHLLGSIKNNKICGLISKPKNTNIDYVSDTAEGQVAKTFTCIYLEHRHTDYI